MGLRQTLPSRAAQLSMPHHHDISEKRGMGKKGAMLFDGTSNNV